MSSTLSIKCQLHLKRIAMLQSFLFRQVESTTKVSNKVGKGKGICHKRSIIKWKIADKNEGQLITVAISITQIW